MEKLLCNRSTVKSGQVLPLHSGKVTCNFTVSPRKLALFAVQQVDLVVYLLAL
jgi:hypothetical protein